jgi:DNA-binding HxlR family transcriptional regulator
VFGSEPAIHNDAVPTPAQTDLPSDVERAIDILGNRVRVAVLRSLILDGPATRSELSQRLNLSVSLLQAHLRRLAEFGAITQDPAGSRPDHRKRVYRARKKDVEQLLNALVSSFRR